MYMVIDERRDHSFRVPRPDISAAIGTTNACNNCHTKPNETFQWAADAIKKWYGEKKSNQPPHWAAAINAGRDGTPEGERLLLDLLSHNTTPAIVRATAIELLGNYATNASVTARRAALNDSDPQVRLSAIHVIPTDSPDLLVADLASMLSDSTRGIRIAAASQLAHLPLDKLTDSQRHAFEQAMIEFRDSQKLSLDHAGAHLALAAADRRHGNIEQAIDHLTTAIKLEPYLTGARAELASLMLENGGDPAEIRRLNSEEADLLERDTKLAPTNADIFYRLGLIRYLLGEYDKADAAFKKASELAPRNYDFRMALALLEQKRYEETGDAAFYNATIESLKVLRELNRDDERGKQIYFKLQEARKQREGGASPPAETPTTGPRL